MEPSLSCWFAPAMEPEQKLWMAVLETALDDALSSKDPVQMEKARRWFRDGGQNFKLVCDLANFDPSFVRKKILPIIDI